MTVVQDYTVISLSVLVIYALYQVSWGCVAKEISKRGAAAAVLVATCGLLGILAQYGDPGIPPVVP